MPKKLHEALRKSAKRKGLKGKRKNRYIYGSIQKVENRKRGKSKR
jgi:hypothetical protein